jgi:hypothetical protein
MMKTTAVALLFLFTAMLGAQPSELRIERPVARPDITAVATLGQPLIATDGSAFLAVWGRRTAGFYPALYVSRLDANGTLLDPLGIRLVNGFPGDLIWTGRSYLLAAGTEKGWEIFSLDAGANILARNVVGDRQEMGEGIDLRLATNGTTAMVAGGNGVGIRTDLDGKSINSFRFATSTTPGLVDIASNGSAYMVSYVRLGELYARPISDAGRRGEPVLLASNELFTDVALESSGGSYLALWSGRGVFAQRVDDQGVPNFEKQTVQTIAASASASALRVARDGDGFALTNAVGLSLFETRLSSHGQPLTAPRPFALGSAADVAVAGSTKALVWRERRGQVHSGVARNHGALENVSLLSRGVAAQTEPQLAAAGETIVSVWREENELRIARAGGEPQIVAEYASRHEIVSDGSTFWVLWFGDAERLLFVKRYTTNLEPVDDLPLSFTVPESVAEWDVAAGENGVIIVWRIAEAEVYIGLPPGAGLLSATLLNANAGAVHATTIPIGTDPPRASQPAVVWNGIHYVIFWALPEDSDILAMRVTRSGIAVDPVPIVVHDGTQAVPITGLDAAHGADGIAVVWQEQSRFMYGAIFRGDPRPPAHELRHSFEPELFMRVLSVPSGYVLMWSEYAAYGTYIQRFDAALDPVRNEQRVIEVVVNDVVATGEDLHFGYVRVVHEEPFDGVPRAFIGSTVRVPRTRVVR